MMNNKKRRPQWEYEIIEHQLSSLHNAGLEKILSKKGMQGWEVINVLLVKNNGKLSYVYHFKRLINWEDYQLP